MQNRTYWARAQNQKIFRSLIEHEKTLNFVSQSESNIMSPKNTREPSATVEDCCRLVSLLGLLWPILIHGVPPSVWSAHSSTISVDFAFSPCFTLMTIYRVGKPNLPASKKNQFFQLRNFKLLIFSEAFDSSNIWYNFAQFAKIIKKIRESEKFQFFHDTRLLPPNA